MTKPDPFRYFKTSREIIRLAVMLYVRFPLSLRNVEDLLHERGIDVSHEAVRFWWHRLGPIFAAEIRKRLITGMKSSKWRWHLDEMFVKIAAYNNRIRHLFRSNEMCQRIGKIEGIGPITATALVAAVGDRTCFRNGRQFAAWLGLVPKQRSSDGKSRLFGISKRGDRYLRTLMIHGARAVLAKASGKTDARSLWIGRMRDRRHPNVVAVALANKNARIVWSVLSGGEEYQPAISM